MARPSASRPLEVRLQSPPSPSSPSASLTRCRHHLERSGSQRVRVLLQCQSNVDHPADQKTERRHRPPFYAQRRTTLSSMGTPTRWPLLHRHEPEKGLLRIESRGRADDRGKERKGAAGLLHSQIRSGGRSPGRGNSLQMRLLFPTALELVYDNYNALAIGLLLRTASEAIFSIALYPKWVSLFFLQQRAARSRPNSARQRNSCQTRRSSVT